ncbi:TPM domain-containing protein [Enterococcus asini]|uniref:TPM domain-containing protein n=1 Tax=Enterococcus asini TaxID=57732 RepID=UPI0028903822|nr:TPM domain-containing protein [Enterococcus asini]MDT2756373.1 TPM domain-containing protein [Enterococcus asini]
MKKLFLFLFGLVALGFPLHVMADTEHVEDSAGLFSETQLIQLEEQATNLSDTIKGDVYLVTSNTNTTDSEEYAQEYLRTKVGNNNNGAVLFLDMNQRVTAIKTSGNMIDYLTDARLESIFDELQEQMGAGNYFEAGSNFFEMAAGYVEDGVPSGHYRVDEETGKITYYKTISPFEAFIAVVLAAVLAVAFFVVIKSRYQLKLGTYKYPYQENSQVNLTVNENQLTNSFVTTRRIPRNNNNSGGFGGGGGSTTSSSGGGTFGGGSRGF